MGRMITEAEIGQWYRDIQNRFFEVVALDDDTIEVQFFDGDVEELDRETWELLCVVESSEPSDASGPFDEPDADMDESYSNVDEELRPVSWDSLMDEY